VDDVAVKHLVDQAAHRLDVEHVHVGEDVIGQQHLGAGGFKQLLHRLAHGDVASIQHRHAQF